MNLGLLLPLGLAALAALIVPLLIHLLRRPDDRVVIFPALRWLAAKARPRRRPRFDDLWLLLLRLLLVALLALLMAEPFVEGAWRSPRTWVVVAVDAELADSAAQSIDPSAHWRWLAVDFPSIDAPRPVNDQPLASLLREFDAAIDKRDRLIVVAPKIISGLDGERLRLSRAVDWRVVDAVAQARSSHAIKAPVGVALRYAEHASDAARVLRAVGLVWMADDAGHYLLDQQLQGVAVDEQSQWLIWTDGVLSPAAKTWVEQGGTALIVDPDDVQGIPVWTRDTGEVLARRKALGTGRLIALQYPLMADVFPELLDASFPARLQGLFVGAPAGPSRALASAVKPEFATGQFTLPVRESVLQWLALLIGIVFLVERVLATRRRAAA